MEKQNNNEQDSIKNIDEEKYQAMKVYYSRYDKEEANQSSVDFIIKKGSVTITGFSNRTIRFQGRGMIDEKNKLSKALYDINQRIPGYLTHVISAIFDDFDDFDAKKICKRKAMKANHKKKYLKSLFSSVPVIFLFLASVVIGIISWIVYVVKFPVEYIPIVTGIISVSIPPYIAYLVKKYQDRNIEQKRSEKNLELINHLLRELTLTSNIFATCEKHINGIIENGKVDNIDDQTYNNLLLRMDCDRELLKLLINRINVSNIKSVIDQVEIPKDGIERIQYVYYALEELIKWQDKSEISEIRRVYNYINFKIEELLGLLEKYLSDSE